MKIIVSYDVATTTPNGRKRLRRVAKSCQNYGVRVQFSVFECSVAPKDWLKLRASLLSIINEEEDSLRFWFLGDDEAQKTEHHGVRKPLDLDGPLVF
ncbi:MAG: CRISPR-associated endonuclease Cas2 [Myxococcales bacterium]|jgi:CRISPR-associated protein Cas2|nr:CRISPR-associated endonuclease Cas2 [Myxococcales bacterium]